MTFYPAGNPSGGSGQSLSWAAGGSDTEVIEENVGTMNQLTFVNGDRALPPFTATSRLTVETARPSSAAITRNRVQAVVLAYRTGLASTERT